MDTRTMTRIPTGKIGSFSLAARTLTSLLLAGALASLQFGQAHARTNIYGPAIKRGLVAAGVLNPAIETFSPDDVRKALELYRQVYTRGKEAADEAEAIRAFTEKLNAYAKFKTDTQDEGRHILIPTSIVTRRDVATEHQTSHLTQGSELELYTFRYELKNNTPSEALRNVFTRARNANIVKYFQSNRAFVANLFEARLSPLTGRPDPKMRFLRAFTRDGYLTGLYVTFDRDQPPASFTIPAYMQPLRTYLTPPLERGLDRIQRASEWADAHGLDQAETAELTKLFVNAAAPPSQTEIDNLVRNWIWRRTVGAVTLRVANHFERGNRWHIVTISKCLKPRETAGKPYRDVRVIFATNRNALSGLKNSSPNARSWFGTDVSKNNELQVGCAIISVPTNAQSHELMPTQYSQGWMKDPAPQKKDDAKLFRVRAVKQLGIAPASASAQRLKLVDRELGTFDNKQRGLIFVHGYNTSFENALLRTAQLAASIEYPGRVYLFSWPSAEQPLSYMSDMDSAERSELHLSGYLRAILRDGAIRRLDIVAHSMGSQMTIRALGDLRDLFFARHDISLGQVIFAAPDVAVSVFTEKIREISYLAPSITVYGSAKDKALGLSRTLRGTEKRLGQILDIKEIPVELPKLTVIDATTPSNICNGWGVASVEHNYFGSNPVFLKHLQKLLVETVLRNNEESDAQRWSLKNFAQRWSPRALDAKIARNQLVEKDGTRQFLKLPNPECWWNWSSDK